MREEHLSIKHIFLVMAALLPVLAIFLRHSFARDEVRMHPVTIDGLALEMPAEVYESHFSAANGIHYVTAADDKRMAAVALVPVIPGGKLAAAAATGAPAMAKAFQLLFFGQNIRDLSCEMDKASSDVFVLHGMMADTKQRMAGVVAPSPKPGMALVAMVASSISTEPDALLAKIRKSMRPVASMPAMPAEAAPASIKPQTGSAGGSSKP